MEFKLARYTDNEHANRAKVYLYIFRHVAPAMVSNRTPLVISDEPLHDVAAT